MSLKERDRVIDEYLEIGHVPMWELTSIFRLCYDGACSATSGCSSEGEHHLDTVGAIGSIPISRTRVLTDLFAKNEASTDSYELVDAFLLEEKLGCSDENRMGG